MNSWFPSHDLEYLKGCLAKTADDFFFLNFDESLREPTNLQMAWATKTTLNDFGFPITVSRLVGQLVRLAIF